ncbi:hypothetical protein CAPTEDRAFT_187570, partial [Capitella teleta]
MALKTTGVEKTENPLVTLDTDSPDLTRCFQDTVVTYIPVAFIWLIAPFYLWSIRDDQSKTGFYRGPKSYINICKMVLTAFLCTVASCSGLHALVELTPQPFSVYTAIGLDIATYVSSSWLIITTSHHFAPQIVVLFIIHEEYNCGIHTSGPLFVFFLLEIIAGSIAARSTTINKEINDPTMNVLVYVRLSLQLMAFLLVCLVDIPVPKSHKSYSHELLSEQTPLISKNEDKIEIMKENNAVVGIFWSSVIHMQLLFHLKATEKVTPSNVLVLFGGDICLVPQ